VARQKPVDPETLPYRPCIGAMVLNAEGLVWVGHRLAEAKSEMTGAVQLWQMPQGGIDAGEEPLATARRELYEETGMEIGVAWKGKYRGQTQKWFAFRFHGDDSEIRINPPPGNHTAEFDRYDWRRMDELTGLIVPFKRQVYEQVVAAFRHLVA
jgi:putative (di)nucleoside polyphosphate hydrolase